MRERRHDNVAGPICEFDERSFNEFKLIFDLCYRSYGPKTEIRRHLIIPAPSRVQLPPRLADAFDEGVFDDHVDVFEALIKRKIVGFDVELDPAQAFDDLVALGIGDQADLGEHGGVGDGAGDVLFVDPAVVGDRFDEAGGELVAPPAFADAGLPGFIGGIFLTHARHCSGLGSFCAGALGGE